MLPTQIMNYFLTIILFSLHFIIMCCGVKLTPPLFWLFRSDSVVSSSGCAAEVQGWTSQKETCGDFIITGFVTCGFCAASLVSCVRTPDDLWRYSDSSHIRSSHSESFPDHLDESNTYKVNSNCTLTKTPSICFFIKLFLIIQMLN